MQHSQVADVVIHHLTDVHIGPLHYQADRKLAFVEAYNPGWNNLRKYVSYLRQCNREKRRLPDLIVVSGDFTSYATEAEFNKTHDELREIRDIIAGESHGWRRNHQPCIFIVPGNHDLDWSKQEDKEKLDRFIRMADALGPLVKSPTAGAPFYDFYPERNLLIYLFNSCVLGGRIDPEIATLFSKLHSDLTAERHREYVTELEKLARRDPGYIHPQQLEALASTLPAGHRNRLKIAVMHHNPSSVPSEDIEAFDTIINAGVVKDWLLKEGFDIVLHGHRHLPHCSYEEHMEPLYISGGVATDLEHLPYEPGLYILAGDSLGVKETSRFFELELFDAKVVHGPQPPATLVQVAYAESGVVGYTLSPRYRFAIGRPTTASMKYIQERLERRNHENPELVRKTLNVIAPSFRRLQSLVDDWEDDANWQRVFCQYLPLYKGIYGVDLLGPSAWLNPNYLNYVAQQFQERLKRLRGATALRFSPPVQAAVKRTGWVQEDQLRGFEVSEQEASQADLEIVRILLWEESAAQDQSTLEMIDRYHRLFGVPVFVLVRSLFNPEEIREEFVIAIDQANTLHCFCFNLGDTHTTDKTGHKDAARLFQRFNDFMAHPKLLTIPQFLNSQGAH